MNILGPKLGLLLSLMLVILGLVLLPQPALESIEGTFAALYLLLALLAAVAFGKEVWRLERLSQIRTKWRRESGRRKSARNSRVGRNSQTEYRGKSISRQRVRHLS